MFQRVSLPKPKRLHVNGTEVKKGKWSLEAIFSIGWIPILIPEARAKSIVLSDLKEVEISGQNEARKRESVQSKNASALEPSLNRSILKSSNTTHLRDMYEDKLLKV